MDESGSTVGGGGRGLLKAGVIGAAVTALCCFTPILVVLFGVVGLSAMVGWLDYVLMPALAGFVLLTFYALWRRRAATAAAGGDLPK